jgi:hypothetical protein
MDMGELLSCWRRPAKFRMLAYVPSSFLNPALSILKIPSTYSRIGKPPSNKMNSNATVLCPARSPPRRLGNADRRALRFGEIS